MSTYTLVTKTLKDGATPQQPFTAGFVRRDDGVHFAASMLWDPVAGDVVGFQSAVSDVEVVGRDTHITAASNAGDVLAASAGKILEGFWWRPSTTSPGAVTVSDGTTVLLALPAKTVADTTPVFYYLGAKGADAAGFKVATGANVSVLSLGKLA